MIDGRFEPRFAVHETVAIDLSLTGESLEDRGKLQGVAALGDGYRDHPRVQGLDLPRLGSGGRWFPLATKTLVIARQGGTLEAFDKTTGEFVGEFHLPEYTDQGPNRDINGAPMTYMLDGKQHIVFPIGGAAKPSELIALSLP
ncbi:MAG: hypothetical protein IH986_04600 [Planctomycetes bacterium]|nr:hypothetical protein [Planctomycetota bacterium]